MKYGHSFIVKDPLSGVVVMATEGMEEWLRFEPEDAKRIGRELIACADSFLKDAPAESNTSEPVKPDEAQAK